MYEPQHLKMGLNADVAGKGSDHHAHLGSSRAPEKRGIEDNSKIIFHISQQKHVVTPH